MSPGPARFRIAPALLRPPQTYDLDQDRLSLLDAQNRPVWRLDLRQIRALTYARTTVRGTTTRSLDLRSDQGARRLTQTLSAADTGPPPRAFADLLGAVLQAVARHHPGMQVTLGLPQAPRLALFAIAALALGAGLALPVLMLVSGVSADRFLPVLPVCLLLCGMGLGYGWPNRPWRPQPRLPIRQVIAALGPAPSDRPAPPSD